MLNGKATSETNQSKPLSTLEQLKTLHETHTIMVAYKSAFSYTLPEKN